jgi:hypothetical protein
VKINRPTRGPTYCLPKIIHTFSCEKVPQKLLVTLVIFKKTAQMKNRPMGKKSSNLVTLLAKVASEP